jgi:hypothetical protein
MNRSLPHLHVPESPPPGIQAGRAVRYVVAVLAMLLGSVQSIPALAVVDADGDASSSRAARDEAARAIPWQHLGPNERRVTQSIVNSAGIFRRLPTRIIDCDPQVFTFLMQHPEVVAEVWRVMGISQMRLDKLHDGSFRGDDGVGTTGTVRFLAGSWGPDANITTLVLADGGYDGKPFVMPLRAKSIVLVRSGGIRERNGRYYITVRADAFVHVDQMAVELVAKTVQPWVNATADRNLVETLSFVSNFSRTAEKNPEGMRRLAARLTTIDEPTRNELVDVCFRTAARYSQGKPKLSTESAVVALGGAR